MDKASPHSVAVTGATGFIGRAVVAALARAGIPVAALSRSPAPNIPPPGASDAPVTWHRVSAYDDVSTLTEALAGAGAVVHLADDPNRARAAQTGEQTAETVLRVLLRAMVDAGTQRLILTSSVYARLDSRPGSYGHAKARTEAALAGLVPPGADAGPAWVVLRLPPVYGLGGHGGFAALTRLAGRGLPLPLPFGLARAPRAYLARANLVDLIAAMVQAGEAAWTQAAGRIFEPSDGAPIDTASLIRALARAQGRSARLVPVPLPLLRALGRATGKTDLIAGAIDPLAVEGNAPLTEIFGWVPTRILPESLDFLAEG